LYNSSLDQLKSAPSGGFSAAAWPHDSHKTTYLPNNSTTTTKVLAASQHSILVPPTRQLDSLPPVTQNTFVGQGGLRAIFEFVLSLSC